jgi:hypothetical protein
MVSSGIGHEEGDLTAVIPARPALIPLVSPVLLATTLLAVSLTTACCLYWSLEHTELAGPASAGARLLLGMLAGPLLGMLAGPLLGMLAGARLLLGLAVRTTGLTANTLSPAWCLDGVLKHTVLAAARTRLLLRVLARTRLLLRVLARLLLGVLARTRPLLGVLARTRPLLGVLARLLLAVSLTTAWGFHRGLEHAVLARPATAGAGLLLGMLARVLAALVVRHVLLNTSTGELCLEAG